MRTIIRMKIKRLFLLIIVFICLPLFLHSQSNTVIDELLDKEKADWGQTTYLVLTAAELLDENADMTEVMATLEVQQWRIDTKDPDEFISLGEYSYLLMKAFDLTGGLMYKLLPGPRYAARELDYLDFIYDNKSPYRTLSGEEVLRILGKLLEWKEETL